MEISKRVDGRTDIQCRNYWTKTINASRGQEQWTATLRSAKYCAERTPASLIANKNDGMTRVGELQTLMKEPTMLENTWERLEWTHAEDETLLRLLLEADSKVNWKEFVQSLAGRTESDCRERWIFSLRSSSKTNAWTSEQSSRHEQHHQCTWTLEEDEALCRLHAVYGNLWSLVARQMSGHSHLQCRHRWLKVLNPSLSFGSWTNDEDAELVQSYGVYGKQWSLIAECIAGHDEFECRNRSLVLVGKERWSAEEDAILRRLHSVHGADWNTIADGIPNRTSFQCRYRALVRRVLPAHMHAQKGQNAPLRSPASKRPRIEKHASSSSVEIVAHTSSHPTANENDGFAMDENRSKDVEQSSKLAEKFVPRRYGPISPPAPQGPRINSKCTRL